MCMLQNHEALGWNELLMAKQFMLLTITWKSLSTVHSFLTLPRKGANSYTTLLYYCTEYHDIQGFYIGF